MIALIAGTGALPGVVAAEMKVPPLVCALEGNAPDNLTVDVTFRLETLGTFLTVLRDNGVQRLCMSGAIGRPAIDPNAIDVATRPLVPVIAQAMASGDDGALRAAITIFEQAGFQVSGAHEIAPDLLPPLGYLTDARPGKQDQDDVTRGAAIITAMAGLDIGQACVVWRHQALAIEGAFGTDWMLRSLTTRPDAGGGVLFKAPKPGQDRRVDLPTIGPDTITAACAAGLGGLAIEAGGVMVLERARTLSECNRLGLFLWVRGAG
ncbi:MAG: UDP-2,3-diacylglucosamine diphosphatase LpxI [Rhodobacteraceae bacterium]|nr:UDP-2,3-diacylglucosamine diphosphatase LpxI [Paracoccaceae bacterium]